MLNLEMKESLGIIASGVVSSISEGGIFIYSYSAQLISFEIDSISKEINCAEYEYMNMPPSLVELTTPLAIIPRDSFISKFSTSHHLGTYERFGYI